MSGLTLGRYSPADIREMLEAEGVLDTLRERGFDAFEVCVRDGAITPLGHIELYGNKNEARHLLFDACLTEARVSEPPRWCHGLSQCGPADVLVVYWFREQDPTRPFPTDRPRLPLQEHPGLGVLRSAFRVVLLIARELGKDGVACFPKYYHDAVIYHRSRLFSFLVAREEGRFEALRRDLAGLDLLEATLAVTGGAVRDRDGRTLKWSPGFQMLPLASGLIAYFNSPEYAREAASAAEEACFNIDSKVLDEARGIFEASTESEAR